MEKFKNLLAAMIAVVLCFGYFLYRAPMKTMSKNYEYQKAVETLQQSKKDYGDSFDVHDAKLDRNDGYIFTVKHPTGSMKTILTPHTIFIECNFQSHMLYTNHEWIEGNEVYTRVINNLGIGGDIKDLLKDIKVEGTNFEVKNDDYEYSITGEDNHDYYFKMTIHKK